jgi:hypothetical protein
MYPMWTTPRLQECLSNCRNDPQHQECKCNRTQIVPVTSPATILRRQSEVFDVQLHSISSPRAEGASPVLPPQLHSISLQLHSISLQLHSISLQLHTVPRSYTKNPAVTSGTPAGEDEYSSPALEMIPMYRDEYPLGACLTDPDQLGSGTLSTRNGFQACSMDRRESRKYRGCPACFSGDSYTRAVW